MEYEARMRSVQRDLRQTAVETACRLFLRDGIAPVTMAQTAKEAGIGVASLYRWFGTKRELVIEAGVRVWRTAGEYLDGVFVSPAFLQKNGLERAHDLLKLFYAAYAGHPDVLRFLRDFDHFAEAERITPEELSGYEASILNLQVPAKQAYELGRKDGSIREIDFDAFYFTATHALLSLAEKLVCEGGLVKSDAAVSGEKQLLTLIDMMLAYLRA